MRLLAEAQELSAALGRIRDSIVDVVDGENLVVDISGVIGRFFWRFVSGFVRLLCGRYSRTLLL